MPSPTKKAKRVIILSVLAGLGLAMWLTYTHGHITPVVASPNNPSASQIYVSSDTSQAATAQLAQVMKGPHSLEGAKLAAANAVSERLKEIDSLQSNVSGSSSLETAEKTALQAEISQMRSGLSSLSTTISSAMNDDSSFEQSIADITGKYPVFSVLLPQVQGLEVVGSDSMAVANGVQTDANLQTIDVKAKKNGANVAAFENDIRTYSADLQSIASLLVQAKTAFAAIDPTNLQDAQGKRDSGINLLQQASNKVNEASAFLTQTVSPLAKSLNR